MTTNSTPVIRPAATNGKISATSMIVALVNSGVPLENIAIYKQMTEADKAQVRAVLA